MKKEYESPKAEKVEFDYSEIVVASKCSGGVSKDYINGYTGCDEDLDSSHDPYGSN